MIDIENEVYSRIQSVLKDKYTDINVASEYVNAPSAFPHVSITMSDNYMMESALSSADTESYSVVMFEVNVYSNKKQGKKTEAKAIMNTIDKALYTMNFKRTALTPVPNLEDATIYRLVARYNVVTDGKTFYRR